MEEVLVEGGGEADWRIGSMASRAAVAGEGEGGWRGGGEGGEERGVWEKEVLEAILGEGGGRWCGRGISHIV